ncbi:SpoIID/LytB domain-containing protein [Candidatus Babeliales bacterium]|nr:SpoIID/LytB domain-containing protein [Candidatus Babeliales bacterium]
MMWRGKWFVCCAIFQIVAQDFTIRVLLDEESDSGKHWIISGDRGVYVSNPQDPSRCSQCQQVAIGHDIHGLIVYDENGRCVRGISIVKIEPVEGNCFYDDRYYQGTLYTIWYDNQALLINQLDLEDYLYSVLRAESFPGWPLEMNKIIAITCRSYAIAKIMSAQKRKKPYHIKSTNKHQTYRGYHNREILRKAVKETEGLFLAYEEKPILAMFDICCGGVIPAKKSGMNFQHAPYLKRSYACTHCMSCKSYQWSTSYTLQEFEVLLRKEIPRLRGIKSVQIHKKDSAGVVKSVLIKANSGYHYISGSKLLSLSENMKSACFTMKQTERKITMHGKGFGHHMGLCQWGARQLVKDCWPYERILNYYYPETTIMKLRAAEISHA